MAIYIILGVVLIILIYVIATYNSFIKLKNNISEAFATMDVYLKKRWDLIPNIMESLKGYTKHEKETFKEVIKLRNENYDDIKLEDKLANNEKLDKNLNKIIALSESYPDLKANENFMNLSNELASIEEDIANSRKYYNAVVENYNNKVELIPSNLVAKICGFEKLKMFEATQEEKENIKVEL